MVIDIVRIESLISVRSRLIADHQAGFGKVAPQGSCDPTANTGGGRCPT